jgi:hypothetical protein
LTLARRMLDVHVNMSGVDLPDPEELSEAEDDV